MIFTTLPKRDIEQTLFSGWFLWLEKDVWVNQKMLQIVADSVGHLLKN